MRNSLEEAPSRAGRWQVTLADIVQQYDLVEVDASVFSRPLHP